MHVPKKYFQDRLVLLLLSINVFLATLGSILILLRLDTGRSDEYFIMYRANLGLSAFTSGGLLDILSFIGFAVIVLVLHTVISMKAYNARRHFSTAFLGLATLLLVVSLIVSNALLELR